MRLRLLLTLMLIEAQPLLRPGLANAAGYSCIGQTFSLLQTIQIQAATDTTLSIQGCTYSGGMTIVTIPAATTLQNFALTISDTVAAGAVKLIVDIGATSQANLTRLTLTTLAMTVNLQYGGTVRLASVSASQFTWTGGITNGLLEVQDSTFQSASNTVFISAAPTTGVGAVHRWRNNTISTTAPGYYAVYYYSSNFGPGARLELMENRLQTPQHAASFALYVSFSGGTINYEGSNRVMNGGISIGSSLQDLSDMSLQVVNSSFFAPISIIVANKVVRSFISIRDSTLTSLSISFTSVSSQFEYIGVTQKNSLAIGIVATAATKLTLYNSTVLGDIVLGPPMRDSAINVSYCKANSFALNGAVTTNSTVNVEYNQFEATASHAIHVSNAPASQGSLHRYVGNLLATDALLKHAVYYDRSSIGLDSRIIFSQNELRTPNSVSCYAVYVTLAGGTIRYEESNRIRYGGISVLSSEDLVGSLIHIANSSIAAPVGITSQKSIMDFSLTVEESMLGTVALTSSLQLVDSAVLFRGNTLAGVTVTASGSNVTVCYLGNNNSAAVNFAVTANQGSMVTLGNSVFNSGVSIKGAFQNSKIFVFNCQTVFLNMMSATMTNSSLVIQDSVLQGPGNPFYVSGSLVGANSYHRLTGNTISTSTPNYYAIYYYASSFGVGARLELSGNVLQTPANALSYALFVDFAGGTIYYDINNRVTNGGISITATAPLNGAWMMFSDSNFFAPFTVSVKPMSDSVLSIRNSTVASMTLSFIASRTVIEYIEVTQKSTLSLGVTANSGTSIAIYNSTIEGEITAVAGAVSFTDSAMKISGSSATRLYLKFASMSNSTLDVEDCVIQSITASAVYFEASPIGKGTTHRFTRNLITTTAPGYNAVHYYNSDFSTGSQLILSGNHLRTPVSPASMSLQVLLAGGTLRFKGTNQIINGGLSITLTLNGVNMELDVFNGTLAAPITISFTGLAISSSLISIRNCSSSVVGGSLLGGMLSNSAFSFVGNSFPSFAVILTSALTTSELKVEDNSLSPTAPLLQFGLSSQNLQQSVVSVTRNKLVSFNPSVAGGLQMGSKLSLSGNNISSIVNFGTFPLTDSILVLSGNSIGSTLSWASAGACVNSTVLVANSNLALIQNQAPLRTRCAFRFLGNTVRNTAGAGGGLTLAPAASSAVVELLGNVFQVGGLSISGTADTVQLIGNKFESDPSTQMTLSAVSGVNGRLAACNTLFSGGSSVSVSSNSFTNVACTSSQTYARCSADPAVPVTTPAISLSMMTCNPIPLAVQIPSLSSSVLNAVAAKVQPSSPSLAGFTVAVTHCQGSCCSSLLQVEEANNTLTRSPTTTKWRAHHQRGQSVTPSSISQSVSASASQSLGRRRGRTRTPVFNGRNRSSTRWQPTPHPTLAATPGPAIHRSATKQYRGPHTLSQAEIFRSATVTVSKGIRVQLGAAAPPRSRAEGLVSSEVQKVLVSVSVASAALSTLTSFSTVAVQVGRIGAVKGIVWCAYDADSDSKPDRTELPIQEPLGDGVFALYVGAIVENLAVFVLLPFAGLLVGFFVGRRKPPAVQSTFRRVIVVLQSKVFSTLFFMGLGYFGPTTFKPFFLTITHHGNSLEVVVVVVAAAVVSALFTVLSLVVCRLVPRDVLETPSKVGPQETREESKEEIYQNKVQDSMFIESIGPAFDGGRNLQWYVRVYYLEDLGVACIMQALAGIRPSSNTDCDKLAIATLAVIVLHLLYLLAVRPYRNAVEQWSNVVGAIILGAMMIAGCVVTLMPEPTEKAQAAFDILSLIQNVYFFLQAVVALVDALGAAHRRRVLSQWRRMEKCVESTTTEMEEPLLVVTLPPHAVEPDAPRALNPLGLTAM